MAKKLPIPANAALEAMRQQILDAVKAFASPEEPVAKLLAGLASDVERASGEPLEIFPVCHHSPASAIHLLRRVSQAPPRVIFMEMCEDLRPLLDGLVECRFPVALQAFALSSESFPRGWAPLSVVAPLTEFS